MSNSPQGGWQPAPHVKAVMARDGIPQTALARASRLHPKTVSRILSGARPAGELASRKLVEGLRLLGIDPMGGAR